MLRITRLAGTLQAILKKPTGYAKIVPIGTSLRLSHMQLYPSFATLKPTLDENNDFQLQGGIEENNQSLKVDYKQAIKMYPFHHIPIALIRNPDKFDLEPQIKKYLIAFKTLRAKGKDLQLARDLLLTPKQREAIQNQAEKHHELRIFQYYFQSKIQQFMRMLNSASGAFDDRLMAIVIVAQMNGMYLLRKGFRILDERKIVKQDETGVLAAYYVRYAIRNELDYIHLLPLLVQKMQGENPAESKLMIARSIFSADKFETYYPQKLIDLALKVYTNQLPQLHNYEILYMMRLAYPYHSETARKFGEALIQHIKNKHVVEGNIHFHVPMILKAIKYCSKRRLSCEQLTNFITQNMVRFKAIFEKKNISKGLLFSLMFTRTNFKDISEQMIGYLREFFLTTIEEIAQADEVEEGQLLRVSKLLIRYFDRLSYSQKELMRQKYIDTIIPQFYQHDQILLYSILVVLREKLVRPEDSAKAAKFDRDIEFIKKMIIRYLQSCSEKVNGKLGIVRHINSAVELMYQIKRHELDLPLSKLPSLLAYDFSKKDTVSPQVLGFFFSYLSRSQEKQQDIRKALDQFEPYLQIYFRKNKILSLNTIYSIINVCANVNYDHDYLFKHIENGFGSILIKNSNLFIPENDIKFINNKMLNRGYGSQNLKRFIKGVLENPSNWNKLKFDYVQKEKKFAYRTAKDRNQGRGQ